MTLCFAIATRTDFDQQTNSLLRNIPHVLVPFMETDLVENPKDRSRHHPLLSTHMPFTALPESIIASASKIIYICREPKDTFTSYYLFPNKLNDSSSPEETVCSFEEAFEQFCHGKFAWGPYWDLFLGYWKASVEWPDTVLFLKYEDVKKDTVFCVKKMAEFMGKPFSKAEEEGGVPEKISELCSFENLSGLEVNQNGKHRPASPFEISNSAYFRKGRIVDWKNHLSPQMIDRMDRITKQKLLGSRFLF